MACAESVLSAAWRRDDQAYYPFYAQLAAEARQAMPTWFDRGFTSLVQWYMEQETFKLKEQ
jgi:hypothetical protein